RSLGDGPIRPTHRAKNVPLRSSPACQVSVIFDSSPPTRRAVVPDHAGGATAGSAVGAASRLPPNTVTYTVGRKISVSKVATRRPPIIAKAIGPQNTVGAIGIKPSTVEIAVSISGRMREVAAARTASITFLPPARSVST